MPNIRVLIADDHAMLRDGLSMLVNGQSDMKVIAQAATGHEAVMLCERESPDVAVLDISMPDGDGAQAAEVIRRTCPSVRVLALTRHADVAYLGRMLDAGAAGYLVKRSAADTLIEAIRVVAGGGTYIEPDIAAAAQRATARSRSSGDRERLSMREEEVFRQVAWGRTSKEIAANLAISTKTVESYKAAALAKLNLRTRSDIVRYALARGWLSHETTPD